VTDLVHGSDQLQQQTIRISNVVHAALWEKRGLLQIFLQQFSMAELQLKAEKMQG
jgi:hypothetical protein